MDQMMVDVTDIPEVREDDEAILWGGTVSDTAETIAPVSYTHLVVMNWWPDTDGTEQVNWQKKRPCR